jgi:ornithine--oxo-acid transaminase
MTSRQLIDMVDQYGAHNYHPLEVVLRRGSGVKVWDVEGKEYLDFLACYSALNFGHHHPRLLNKLKEQAESLAVCSRAFHSEELCLFSKELAEFCGLEMVLPMNSGAEAVETALKIARKWGYEKKGVAPERAKIIAFQNNFHGRTIALISFSTEPEYRNNFGPYAPGFVAVPFNDIEALSAAMDSHTVGVLIEPIQAEAGILVPDEGYLAQVRQLCERHGALLMIDEIQTGLGRTGRDFCFQYDGISPDLLILGKSLGGGLVPISAVVGKRSVMEVVRPGQHGSTFGGNPLACALGREVLKLLKEEQLAKKALHIGEIAFEALTKKPLPGVREIRGKGALIGIELAPSQGGARRYTEKLAEAGVLCKETHEHVIRIAPPLIINEEDLKVGLGRIIDVIRGL